MPSIDVPLLPARDSCGAGVTPGGLIDAALAAAESAIEHGSPKNYLAIAWLGSYNSGIRRSRARSDPMATTIEGSAASTPAASRRTTVICLRGHDRAMLLADPVFVYVGWAVRAYGWGGSLWGVSMAGPTASARAAASLRFEW